MSKQGAGKKSAGLLLYRNRAWAVEVFLVHPGGPFWKNKDEGAWSIPKGEFGEEEDPFDAAKREFQEETGIAINAGLRFVEMRPIRQAGGKLVYAWAVEADIDPAAVRSNHFSIELPKGSGRMQSFPEVDRAGWFGLDMAHSKMLASQRSLLVQVEELLA